MSYNHNHSNNGSVIPLVVLGIILFVVATATPFGRNILAQLGVGGTQYQTPAQPVPVGQIPTPVVVTASETDKCMASGGIWISVGGNPGYCKYQPAQPQQSQQPAPVQQQVSAPTAAPPVGTANCAYPMDLAAWKGASGADRDSYISYWMSTTPKRNPWEQYMHEHGMRGAIGSDLSGCETITVIKPQGYVPQTQQAAQQANPPPQQPAASVQQASQPNDQMVWIMNNDPKPYSIAPQLAYMGCGTEEEVISDLKRLADSCKAGQPGSMTETCGGSSTTFTCDNYQWQFFFK